MRKRTSPVGLWLAALLTTPLAGAQTTPSASTPPAAVHWYGWQTLATDGTAVALAWMTVAATNGGESSGPGVLVLGLASIGTYALGAPILHFTHDNPGRGLGSLALRGLLPLLVGETGDLITGCGYARNSCATTGVFLGIASAIALDAAVFSYEQVAPKTDTAPSFTISLDGQRRLLTVQGRF